MDGLRTNVHNIRVSKSSESGRRRSAGISSVMPDFLESAAAQWVITLAMLAALVAVGVYAVQRARQAIQDRGPTPSDLLSDFRELHSRGTLSDEEYKTIKTTLAPSLQKQQRKPKQDNRPKDEMESPS